MTKEEYCFLELWFENYIGRFRNEHKILQPILELKYRHSLRVAENAKLIAEGLGLSEAKRYLAEGTGLVHDIGRFNQFTQHGSFCDATTLNHGTEGRRVLENQKLPILHNPLDREQLLYAVEYHNRNKKEISQGYNLDQDRLLCLIRDADKLDIIEVVLNAISYNGFQDLPLMLPQISLSLKPSRKVLEEAKNTRSVSSINLSTLADMLIMIATWFYDLNYSQSLHLALERNMLSRIQKELPETQSVNNIFADITNIILKMHV